MHGGRRRPPNPAGFHVLRAPVAAELVRASGVGPGELVFDLGAGTGALTAPLARTGARVVAVEREPRLARALERRHGGRVSVVEGDIRTVPLPRRPYRVVANLPFSIVMATIGRLLDDPRGRLTRADLVVPWHTAVHLADPDPSRPRLRRWHRRFEFRVARRLDRGTFRPPPSVAAGLLVVTRRSAVDRR